MLKKTDNKSLQFIYPNTEKNDLEICWIAAFIPNLVFIWSTVSGKARVTDGQATTTGDGRPQQDISSIDTVKQS